LDKNTEMKFYCKKCGAILIVPGAAPDGSAIF